MAIPRYKKLVIYAISFFFISFLSVSWNIYTLVVTPAISKQNASMIITVDPSATAYQFAHLLKEKELIHSARFFLLMIRLEGLSHQLKAGVYQIKPGETAMQLL